MIKTERHDGTFLYEFTRHDLADILMAHVDRGRAMAGKPTHGPYHLNVRLTGDRALLDLTPDGVTRAAEPAPPGDLREAIESAVGAIDRAERFPRAVADAILPIAIDAVTAIAQRFTLPPECEQVGPMGRETGARECALEVRGGDCLCAERMEAAEEIVAEIRKLKA